MKSWSLKVKIGAYAAVLTVVTLLVAAAVIMPTVYYRQLEQLDTALANEAEEFYRDRQNFRGAPADPRKPLSMQVLPLALRNRHLTVWGPEGQILYRSPSLKGEHLEVRTPGLQTVELLGGQCRLATFEKGPYLIEIASPLDAIQGFQGDLRKGLLVALPVAGLVVFLGGILLGRRAVAPVAELTAAAERISAHRPDERLPVPEAQDEIARLTEVLNESFDRMQKSYEAARRFSADASHQLKTPVSVLRLGLDELRQNALLGPGEREEVEVLLQQTRRLSALIEDLLLLAQVDAGRLKLETEDIDLAHLVASALDDLETLTLDQEVDVESEIPDVLTAHGDERGVSLVLQNMVENAAKYVSSPGRIRVTAGSESASVWVRVGNSGREIPAEDQARLFERFYRGKDVGEGTRGQGLGLNIARELARVQGGELSLVQSADQWTEFELQIPSAKAQEPEYAI